MPSIFDRYPYSNTHELNLDWIIKKINEAQSTLEEVENLVDELSDVNNVLLAAQKAAADAQQAAEDAKNAAASTRTDTSLTEAGVAADAKAVGDITINGKAFRTNPVISAADIGAAKVTNTVNGKPLGSNPVLTANDVGALSGSNTINGKPLSSNPVLTGADLGILTFTADETHPSSFYWTQSSEEMEGGYRKIWLNPPMEMDVEYQLMDNYNGLDVFVKRFNIGACPVDGGKAVDHNIEGCIPLSIEAITTGTKYTLPFISSASNKGISIAATPTVINVYSSLSSSNHGDIIVTLKYYRAE